VKSVKKTGRLVIIHDPCKLGGYGQQIISHLMEFEFGALKHPPVLLGSKHFPIPHAPDLQREIFVSDKLILSTLALLSCKKNLKLP